MRTQLYKTPTRKLSIFLFLNKPGFQISFINPLKKTCDQKYNFKYLTALILYLKAMESIFLDKK